MPIETDETTEEQQQLNDPAEDGGPENMSDVLAIDTDDEIPNATINESISTFFLSNNKLTNGLKRTLLNESINNEEIKKFKTTKNNDKEQLESNTSLYNKNITRNNFNEHSYVSKEIPEDKNNEDTSVNHSIEANNVSADQKQKTNSPKKKIICLSNENKSLNKNNANNKCVATFSQAIQSIPTKDSNSENNQNEHVQNKKKFCEVTSPLNRSRSPSLLHKLIVIENSDSENDNTYDVSILAGSSGINNKCKSFNKSNAKNLENSILNETKDVDDSDDDNVVVQEDVSSIDEDDYRIIENENNSDSNILEYEEVDDDDDDDDNNDDDKVDDEDDDDEVNDNDDEDENKDENKDNEEDATAVADDDDDEAGRPSLSNEELLRILRLSKEVTKQNFPILLKLFSSKKLTFEQFEDFCTQIICSVMTENYSVGNYRKDLQKLVDREKCWRMKFQIMRTQLRELDSIVKTHNNDLKENSLARPRIITRTVGLQTNEEMFSQLPVEPSTSESVDITSDDDGVITLDTENKSYSKPSTSSYNETPTLRKILPLPSVSKQTPVLLTKAVPPALPLNPINSNDNGTIDLTEGDDVNIVPTSRLSLEKPPLKIIHRAALNSNISPGSSSQLTRNLTTQMSPKNLTFIEVPKMQLPNSNFVMRTSSVTRSNPQASNMNIPKATIRPFIFKHGQFMPIQFSQVSPRQLQPVTSSNVTYATRQISTTQLRGSLQPVPPAIPITLTTHPAPLPGIPNQRSLPTWKKLPPAPTVSLTNSPEPQNSKALVLSWNLALTRMTADITAYQIYAYHETAKDSPRSDLWKKIGEVNALPLPMACSLTQFMAGERYHFAVRAVDIYTRVGPFSSPQGMFWTFN